MPCKIQLECQADLTDGQCDLQAMAVKCLLQSLLLYHNSISQQRESLEIVAHTGPLNFSTTIMESTLLVPGHSLRKVTNPTYF